MSEFNSDFDPDEVINDFKEKFSWVKNGKGEVEVQSVPKKAPMRILISLLITLVLSAVAYYFMLPPFNIHSLDTYIFIFAVLVIFMVSFFLVSGAIIKPEYKQYTKKVNKVPMILVGVLAVVVIIGFLVGATLFRAKDYTKLMDVQSSNFTEDFDQISFSDVPRLDADATKVVADNRLNELAQYVSQFRVANESYQINYQGKAVRVAPLVYEDVFKWLNNTKNGLPAYMIIDMVKQEASVVELEDGIKYSPSEYFNRKLIRHLRFQFPTLMFDTPNFEIDENGHPYWITASLTKRIGLLGGTDVVGAVMTNAVTGESTYYDISDVPNWVDRVYNDSLIIEQYDYYGKFQNGFFNSLIGQKEVKVTSIGNGYIAMDDDVWLYTGITSITSDESNVGFILTNQRTKETRYYEKGGATETGAMSSAAGAVQNYGYNPSYPILLNVSGEPTYFMALKAKDNTVKMFAMVNLKQRTLVSTGNTPEDCADQYIELLKNNGVATQEPPAEETQSQATVTGTITDVRTAVKEGNTYYYFLINGVYYSISAALSEDAVILSAGDAVTVTFQASDKVIVPAHTITKAQS